MRVRTIFLGVAAITVLAALAVACGDDDSGGKSTAASGGADAGGTSSPAAGATRQPQQPTAAPTTSAKLSDLLKDSSQKTFYVVYDFATSGGASVKGTYTLAQKPPKSLSSFSIQGQGTFTTINDGQQSYTCTKLGEAAGFCTKSGAGGGGAGLSFFNMAAVSQAASLVPDAKEVDGRTIAGRASRCFQYTQSGQTSTLCIENQDGLMTYVETGDASGKTTITATDVKSSVDDKVFDLPYKVQ
jgi:hypothetical protein